MKVGLQIPLFDWPGGKEQLGATLSDVAERAEEAGFDSLWVMDHFFQLDPFLGKAEDHMMECYTTLGFMAAATERIKLGALVGGVIYRYPGLLVKTVTTLDVLSGGRAYWGIGAGWYRREADGLGVPFETFSRRFEWLEEQLQVAHQMWSDDDGPYHGVHYHLEETLCSPQPVSQPHPPVMIGGNGEKKTLRMVAQYADACNLLMPSPEEAQRKLAVLREHCERLGRDYDAIEKTALYEAGRGGDLVADTLATFRGAAEGGIQHAIVNLPNVEEPGVVESLGTKVLPAVRDL